MSWSQGQRSPLLTALDKIEPALIFPGSMITLLRAKTHVEVSSWMLEEAYVHCSEGAFGVAVEAFCASGECFLLTDVDSFGADGFACTAVPVGSVMLNLRFQEWVESTDDC